MTTCALVAASEFNAEHFLSLYNDNYFDYVIAVDGGYASLLDIDVVPDLVMGDFDSLGYTPKNVRMAKYPPEKDASDLELAMKRAKHRMYKEFVIYGALGGRLDHTLSNLALFAAYSEKGVKVTAVGMTEACVFLTGPDVFECDAVESGIISVFAMSDVCEGVTEEGLKYSLDNVQLTNRTSLGLSNEFQGEAVLISVESGTLIIIVPV